MYSLATISNEELSQLLDGKNKFEIEISESVAQFKSGVLANLDFSKPQEIPPTPMILCAEGIAQVLVYGGNDLKGKYMAFVVFVYALSGKIHYTELSPSNYKAVVTWPHA